MGGAIHYTYTGSRGVPLKFTKLALNDAYLVSCEPHRDDRGFFSRSFCQSEFEKLGLKCQIIQSNVSYNKIRGTLRGMHFQKEPHSEAKLVRCTRGSIFDVIIDLRPNSETYCKWVGFELTEDNNDMLYIPEGFAHGFQTLSDKTEVSYQMFSPFVANAASGVRWDDPVFKIIWPLEPTIISEKDLSYPDYCLESHPPFTANVI